MESISAVALSMNTLPYDLLREIWLFLDYETVKILTTVALISLDPAFQGIRELYHDVGVWRARALRELGVNRDIFDHRTEIEEALILPQGLIGNEPHTRYVELVSEIGVVDDSIHFLTRKEIVIRCLEFRNRELLAYHLPLLKKELGLKYSAFVTHLRAFHFDFYQLPRDLVKIITSSEFEDDAEPSLRRLILAGRLDEAEKGIKEIFRPGLELSYQLESHQRELFNAALELGNIEFFMRLITIFNFGLSVGHLDRGIARTRNPKMIKVYYQALCQVIDVDFVSHCVVSPILGYGRKDLFPAMEVVIKESSCPDILDDWEQLRVVLSEVTFCNSYSLATMNYLLRRGVTTDQLLYGKEYNYQSPTGKEASKALGLWLKREFALRER